MLQNTVVQDLTSLTNMQAPNLGCTLAWDYGNEDARDQYHRSLVESPAGRILRQCPISDVYS